MISLPLSFPCQKPCSHVSSKPCPPQVPTSWFSVVYPEFCFFNVHMTCIVLKSFPIKPTDALSSKFLFLVTQLHMFRAASFLILQASGCQTCIKCASADCTVDNSWWWAGNLPETCRIALPKVKILSSVHLLVLLRRMYPECHPGVL